MPAGVIPCNLDHACEVNRFKPGRTLAKDAKDAKVSGLAGTGVKYYNASLDTCGNRK